MIKLLVSVLFGIISCATSAQLALNPTLVDTSVDANAPCSLSFSSAATGQLQLVPMQIPAFLATTSTAGIITTIAGNGTAGYSGDGGSGNSAQIHKPSDIIIAPNGHYIWTEANSNVLRAFAPGKDSIYTIAGTGTMGFSGDGGPSTLAQLDAPNNVVVDVAGNIYIGDTGNSRIRKIDVLSQVISTIAGNGSQGPFQDSVVATNTTLVPRDIEFDLDSNLLIADGNYIRKLNFTTGLITIFAGNGAGAYQSVGGHKDSIAIGNVKRLLADTLGNIWITLFNDYITKLDTAGIITTVAGTGFQGFNGSQLPALTADLFWPDGLVLDNSSLLFTDQKNHSIRRLDLSSGILSPLAGMPPNSGYAGDSGPALSALLDEPQGMVRDSYGSLIFCDRDNNRIRKISGPSWTLTGTPTCSDIGQHPITIGVTNGIDTVYQSFTITVLDTIAPTLTCPANQTTYTTDTICGSLLQWTPPTGADDCSTTTTQQTDSTGLGPNNYFGPGTHTIQYTTTDSSGNSAQCSFTITVIDTIAPLATCPNDTTLQATTASCEAAVMFAAPTTMDLCGSATLTQTDNTGLSNGDSFPLGTTTLEYTATDASGNTTQCAVSVTVIDTIPPTLTCEDTITSNTQQVTWATPQVTDNCFVPALVQTAGPASGSTFNLGQTTIEYTATDQAGNESICTIVVLVDTSTSIPDLSLAQKSFAVYPNPSSGLVQIELSHPALVGQQLTVFNAFGQPHQIVSTSAQFALDLSEIPKGVYVLRLDTDAGPVYRQLILQ